MSDETREYGKLGLWAAGIPQGEYQIMMERVALRHGFDAVSKILVELAPILALRRIDFCQWEDMPS